MLWGVEIMHALDSLINQVGLQKKSLVAIIRLRELSEY